MFAPSSLPESVRAGKAIGSGWTRRIELPTVEEPPQHQNTLIAGRYCPGSGPGASTGPFSIQDSGQEVHGVFVPPPAQTPRLVVVTLAPPAPASSPTQPLQTPRIPALPAAAAVLSFRHQLFRSSGCPVTWKFSMILLLTAAL
jgi:hypothetical protein